MEVIIDSPEVYHPPYGNIFCQTYHKITPLQRDWINRLSSIMDNNQLLASLKDVEEISETQAKSLVKLARKYWKHVI